MTMGVSLIEVAGCIWALMAFLVAWVIADSFGGVTNFFWRFLRAAVLAVVLMAISHLLMRLAFYAWPYMERIPHIRISTFR